MTATQRKLAVVTGASTGIGYELAKLCVQNGFDLIVAADEAKIHTASSDFEGLGARSIPVEADLSTLDGVDKLYAAIKQDGRPVGALLANAGRGLGKGFLDQDFDDVRRVVDTNVTGTLYLLQKVGRDMVAASCSGAQSKCGRRAIKDDLRRTLAETGDGLRRKLRETGRIIGETGARSSGLTQNA